MPLVSMRQLLDAAAEGVYGVGAFNVNNMEQIQAVFEAAAETRSPVIVQASRGARSYTNDRRLRLRLRLRLQRRRLRLQHRRRRRLHPRTGRRVKSRRSDALCPRFVGRPFRPRAAR